MTKTKRQLLQEAKKQLWQNHLNSCKASALGPIAYCRKHNLKRATFYYWKKRLNNESSPISFVPIKINLQPIQKESLVLILNNRYRVEVGADFKADTLKKLVQTLGQL